MKKVYKYETHLHTSEGSACGQSTGAEMARAHKEAGYTGIIVTDHFFNGNSAIDRSLPWKEKIEQFCKGYENAKAEGDTIGLDVFFGFEYGVNAADFLCYGLDKKWLIEHEDIDKINAQEAFKIMRADGGFVVQAHPFRERDYIDFIKLYPRDVDAIEIVNGSQIGEGIMNEMAEIYAKMYNLPMTAGSDTHSVDNMYGSGVETEQKFLKISDYFDAIIQKKVSPIGRK